MEEKIFFGFGMFLTKIRFFFPDMCNRKVYKKEPVSLTVTVIGRPPFFVCVLQSCQLFWKSNMPNLWRKPCQFSSTAKPENCMKELYVNKLGASIFFL